MRRHEASLRGWREAVIIPAGAASRIIMRCRKAGSMRQMSHEAMNTARASKARKAGPRCVASRASAPAKANGWPLRPKLVGGAGDSDTGEASKLELKKKTLAQRAMPYFSAKMSTYRRRPR